MNDNVIYIDVDSTLLLYPHGEEGSFGNAKINQNLVDKIKVWHSHGRTIIVWTSHPDGVDHAIKAANFCKIGKYVQVFLPKPSTIVDDDHLEYYKIIDPLTLEIKK